MTDTESKTLKLFYAAQLVDAAANFEDCGVVEKVTAKKKAEQSAAAPAQLAQLGIRAPRELFERFGAIFGCAAWTVNEKPDGGVTAQTASCLACAIAQKRGAGKPCELYRINPFRALAAALVPTRALDVEETLWDGARCVFTVK